MQAHLLLSSLTLAATLALAETGADRADAVLDRYEQLRPTDSELAMYSLDWAGSYEAAVERARREERPIFLVIIHARYGDLSSGHC